MVREFKLINEKGQKYSLMDIHRYCLLTEPTGLGYSYSAEHEQLGNTFITNLRKIEKAQITGVVNFLNYDNYKKLIDFIESSEKLKFCYKIPSKDKTIRTYFKDIEIQSISKTEIQRNSILSETVTFDCLSLWYEENTFIHNMKKSEGVINWDFKWDSRFANYNKRSVEYINEGHTEAPVVIKIKGPVINPKIQLYIEGELLQEVPFKINIQEYEELQYGTKENDFYLNVKRTDGRIESLFNLDVIEFENDNVIRLPKNKSCELRIIADNEILNAEVTIFSYYKAV